MTLVILSLDLYLEVVYLTDICIEGWCVVSVKMRSIFKHFNILRAVDVTGLKIHNG